MYVAESWRYPVKSMAGEQVRVARIGPLGIEGDRVVHVENARGEVVTARSHPSLLGHPLHRYLTRGEVAESAVEQVIDERVGESAILDSIQTLPARYRDDVVLADVEGAPYRLVAEALHIPVGSVCSRMLHGRARLWASVREHVVGLAMSEGARYGVTSFAARPWRAIS